MKNTFALFAVRKVLSTFKPLLNPSTGRKLRGRDSADAIPCMAPLRQLPGARVWQPPPDCGHAGGEAFCHRGECWSCHRHLCAQYCAMSSAVQQDWKVHLWMWLQKVNICGCCLCRYSSKGLFMRPVSRKLHKEHRLHIRSSSLCCTCKRTNLITLILKMNGLLLRGAIKSVHWMDCTHYSNNR